jgi:predicted HTH domain antitoxin
MYKYVKIDIADRDELKGMFGRLEGLIGTHEITSFDAMTIMDLMRKVSEALLGNRENISKRMGDIMGGHVIMTEAKEILNQGIEQGLERGLEQGRSEERIRIFVDLVNDRVLSLEEAAKRAGMTVDEFKNHIEELD